MNRPTVDDMALHDEIVRLIDKLGQAEITLANVRQAHGREVAELRAQHDVLHIQCSRLTAAGKAMLDTLDRYGCVYDIDGPTDWLRRVVEGSDSYDRGDRD